MDVRIVLCASLYGGQSSCLNAQQILPLAFGSGAREKGVKHSLWGEIKRRVECRKEDISLRFLSHRTESQVAKFSSGSC